MIKHLLVILVMMGATAKAAEIEVALTEDLIEVDTGFAGARLVINLAERTEMRPDR